MLDLVQMGAPPCAPLTHVETQLQQGYGELPIIEWSMENGNTVRIYGNTGAGTLTLIVIVTRNGQTMGCMAMTGENLRIAPQFKTRDPAL